MQLADATYAGKWENRTVSNAPAFCAFTPYQENGFQCIQASGWGLRGVGGGNHTTSVAQAVPQHWRKVKKKKEAVRTE